MAQKAPGKAYRTGISLPELFKMFPDDEAARAWFERERWNSEPWCPHCGSFNVRQNRHKSMPWRCAERECRKRFSVRVGTILEGSHLGYQTWALAIYLLTTSLKGVSSMKLHRDLNITQKSAWFLAHRIRQTFESKSGGGFSGPVEVDEAFFGGIESNKHEKNKLKLGRGTAGKTIVVGVKDRETNAIRAAVVDNTKKQTLLDFVNAHTAQGAKVYSDEAAAYEGILDHEAVKHGVGEYVKGNAHINGMESFWSMMKRAHMGTFHKMSPKHLNRYVHEFSGRHNIRPADTLAQMGAVVRGLEGKRLTYDKLKKPTGRASGAREARVCGYERSVHQGLESRVRERP